MLKYIYQKLNLENIFNKSIKDKNYIKDASIIDEITGQSFNIVDLIVDLNNRVEYLENQVNFLKEENIENSNLIYELMNSLDAIDARIDIVTAKEFLKDTDV